MSLFTKYIVTLGEFYCYDVESMHFMSNLNFKDDSIPAEVTLGQTELEYNALDRHGEKVLAPVPDWFIKIHNTTGVYDGSYASYMLLLREFLNNVKLLNFTNTKKDSYDRIFSALYSKYSPIENTDRYSTHTETKNGSDVTSFAGSEKTTRDNTDTISYGRTDTETLNETERTSHAGMETDTAGKAGSILENTDNDKYTFPYNGNNKEQTDHEDVWKNTRYGKYKGTDGTPTADPYTETTTKSFTDRADTTTRTTGAGGNVNTAGGKDVHSTDGNETKSFTDRADTTTYDTSVSYDEHTHGNIGVTTNQAMITEEMTMREKFNLMNMIVDDYVSSIVIE